MIEPKKYYTAKEAAEELTISVRRVGDWWRDGKLPNAIGTSIDLLRIPGEDLLRPWGAKNNITTGEAEKLQELKAKLELERDIEMVKKSIKDLQTLELMVEQSKEKEIDLQQRAEELTRDFQEKEAKLKKIEEELSEREKKSTIVAAQLQHAKQTMAEYKVKIESEIEAERKKRADANKNLLNYADELARLIYNTHPGLLATEIKARLAEAAMPLFADVGLRLEFDENNQYVDLLSNVEDYQRKSFTTKWEHPDLNTTERFAQAAKNGMKLCVQLPRYGISRKWLQKAFDFISWHVNHPETLAESRHELLSQFREIDDAIVAKAATLEGSKAPEATAIFNYLCGVSDRLEKTVGL